MLQAVEELEVDVGDVVDAVEPVGQARPAKARMRRRNEPAPRGEEPGDFLALVEALRAVQKKKRLAGSRLVHLQVDARDAVYFSRHFLQSPRLPLSSG